MEPTEKQKADLKKVRSTVLCEYGEHYDIIEFCREHEGYDIYQARRSDIPVGHRVGLPKLIAVSHSGEVEILKPSDVLAVISS